MEEVEPEVEEARGDGAAVDEEVRLLQVPAARADDQRRDLLAERIGLAALGVGHGNGAARRIMQVDLASDHRLPGGRGGVFEVGHEARGAAVQRVDDHLAIDRAGNLDPPVGEVSRCARDGPVALADRLGLGPEGRILAGIDACLECRAGLEQTPPLVAEAALQHGDEGAGLVGQDVGEAGDGGSTDLDSGLHGRLIVPAAVLQHCVLLLACCIAIRHQCRAIGRKCP